MRTIRRTSLCRSSNHAETLLIQYLQHTLQTFWSMCSSHHEAHRTISLAWYEWKLEGLRRLLSKLSEIQDAWLQQMFSGRFRNPRCSLDHVHLDSVGLLPDLNKHLYVYVCKPFRTIARSNICQGHYCKNNGLSFRWMMGGNLWLSFNYYYGPCMPDGI